MTDLDRLIEARLIEVRRQALEDAVKVYGDIAENHFEKTVGSMRLRFDANIKTLIDNPDLSPRS